MTAFPGIAPGSILLPKKGISPEKWAVIACDQFTSQPEYWLDVERIVGDSPSTLRLIQPEVFLKDGDRPEEVNAAMRRYLRENVLEERVKNGFVLTERTTPTGTRIGLVAALDLECYDFTTGKLLTRATEDTVADRLPPRVRIRRGAALELPHVLVLIDDPENTVVEAAYENKRSEDLLYDFDLMKNGGHLRGWKIEDEKGLSSLSLALNALNERANGFLYAVGDGNHSLATAKICWEEIKKTASPEELAGHPARYALVEIVNIHSPAIRFEAIHRYLTGVDAKDLLEGFRRYSASRGIGLEEGSEIVFAANGRKTGFSLQNANGLLPVALLQSYLDAYLKDRPEAGIDYVHGEETLLSLAEKPGSVGILLESIPKHSFFDGIRAGGHLPRKTFSMGHAEEKRYYMECRKLIRENV